MRWVILLAAVVFEVIATSLLKSTEGFSKLLPTFLVLIFYAVSFFCLAQVVKTIPVGIAYALWSGVGIFLVTGIAYFMHGQKLDIPAVIGLIFIIVGVGVINLFSSTVEK